MYFPNMIIQRVSVVWLRVRQCRVFWGATLLVTLFPWYLPENLMTYYFYSNYGMPSFPSCPIFISVNICLIIWIIVPILIWIPCFFAAGIDPNISREQYVGEKDWIKKHEAIHDARIVRSCFIRLVSSGRLPYIASKLPEHISLHDYDEDRKSVV